MVHLASNLDDSTFRISLFGFARLCLLLPFCYCKFFFLLYWVLSLAMLPKLSLYLLQFLSLAASFTSKVLNKLFWAIEKKRGYNSHEGTQAKALLICSKPAVARNARVYIFFEREGGLSSLFSVLLARRSITMLFL
jgi:hypothetical protein